jgi:hypothetical protein
MEPVMPIMMDVCEEGYVLLVTYIQPATLEEMIEIVAQGREYRDSIPHTVHTLFDFQQCDKLPLGALKARYSPAYTHPRSGKVAVFSANYPIRMALLMIADLSRSKERLHFFDHFDDAWKFLRTSIAKDKDAEP